MGIFYNFVINDPIIRKSIEYFKNESQTERKIVGIQDSSELLTNILKLHLLFMQEQLTQWMSEFLRLDNSLEFNHKNINF